MQVFCRAARVTNNKANKNFASNNVVNEGSSQAA